MIDTIKNWFTPKKVVESVPFKYISSMKTDTYDGGEFLYSKKDTYDHSVVCTTYDDGSRAIKFYGQSRYRSEHIVTARAEIWRDTGEKFTVEGNKGWDK